ncbi:MAG: DUF3800 domain-containing protein [Candidatus Anammoximicrobium sp.]|mgnify:CR=1 FL=1|nr:DUF3800 domain-containing protein [Candidatus Anammoximicrobium sp.]
MKFEAYCDESNPEVLGSTSSDKKYLLIGGVWLQSEDRTRFKDGIHHLRRTHRIGGEFKWNRISRSRQQFYVDLVNYFFDQGDRLRFRCIVVDREKVDLTRFHESDQELGFYKFYYQLLHHWILDFNEYAFFLDTKKNHRPDRLKVLRRCLDSSNLSSLVTNVQGIDSRQSVLIQLADVLTGCASRKLNESSRGSQPKDAVVKAVEQRLGHQIGPTSRAEAKFNVFRINLSGGW